MFLIIGGIQCIVSGSGTSNELLFIALLSILFFILGKRWFLFNNFYSRLHFWSIIITNNFKCAYVYG